MSIFNHLKAEYGDCEVHKFTAAATLTAGEFLLVGTLVGILYNSGVSGDLMSLLIGVPSPGINVPKAAGAITEGAKVYYNDTNGNVSTTDTDTFIGHCIVAAASGDARVRIRLVNEAG